MKEFMPANLGGRIKLVTIIAFMVPVLALLALLPLGLVYGEHNPSLRNFPWAVFVVCYLFLISFWWWLGWRLKPKAYVIENDRITIKRSSPFRDKRFPLLAGMKVEMIGRMPLFYIQLWGALMPFCMSGLFATLRMGKFRAYLTSDRECVLVGNEKKRLVLSPENPDQFLTIVRQEIGTIARQGN